MHRFFWSQISNMHLAKSSQQKGRNFYLLKISLPCPSTRTKTLAFNLSSYIEQHETFPTVICGLLVILPKQHHLFCLLLKTFLSCSVSFCFSAWTPWWPINHQAPVTEYFRYFCTFISNYHPETRPTLLRPCRTTTGIYSTSVKDSISEITAVLLTKNLRQASTHPFRMVGFCSPTLNRAWTWIFPKSGTESSRSVSIFPCLETYVWP